MTEHVQPQMIKILIIAPAGDILTHLYEVLSVAFPAMVITSSSSGNEGADLAGTEVFDIIFLGHQPDHADSLEVCKVIRETPGLGTTPLIIITNAETGTSERMQFIDLGADAFLIRPFTRPEIITTVKTFIRVKQAEDGLVLERQQLEQLVSERTRTLQEQLDELKNTERELKRSYAELKKTKLAALNLMEDLKAEVDQRKRSEEVLQVSEKRFKDLSNLFRSISDNMTAMLWAKDLDKNYIFANKAFCDHILVAKDTEEPIGKNDMFFALRQRNLNPEDTEWHTFGEICRDSDQVVIDSGRPGQFDEYGKVRGKFIYLDVRKSPLYDIDGNMIGTVGSAQDNTREREMSRQLAERERQLSTLVSNLTGMVYRCLAGYDGEMLFVSDGCLAVTGYSRNDFVENKKVFFNDIILDEYRDQIFQKWERMLNNREIFEGEYPIRTAGGEIKWVWERSRAEYNEKGEVVFVDGYIEDVSLRKRAVEALRESEQRYETFINSTDDFAFLKDENFRYLFINNANAAFFGRKAGDVIGKDDFDLMRKEYALICRENDHYAISSAGVTVNEEIVDGRTYETRKFPVLLQNGSCGVGGYVRDITDRKAAEEFVKKVNDELEERVLERTSQLENANKELEAFSYSVSHDLRAPLRAIDGFTRILYEDYQPLFDDEGKRLCTVIQDNAVRMGQLIDDLLALSRLNRADIHLTSVNIYNLALTVYDEAAGESDKLRTKFQLFNVHPVTGDTGALRQVLFNLIGNSVKFTSKKESAEITLSSELKKNMVVYCVKDNGAGFDMKYSDKLFGAFQRLHSIKEFEGNGIGLAIVKRIIHRHGGQVWAEGEVGKGASFYFSLPLKVKNRGVPQSSTT